MLSSYSTFVLSVVHKRQLTGYITTLFHRSRARKLASPDQMQMKLEAFRALLSDEEALSRLAAKYTMDSIESGINLAGAVPKNIVIEVINRQIERHSGTRAVQSDYINTVELMMSLPDERMINGQWSVFHAELGNPFIIGDAPVVTWERTAHNALMHGVGFALPNVEVLLPISPTTCLHILPEVQRNRSTRRPTTEEVNVAQALFATEHCFSNVRSEKLDATLQPHFGTFRIGIEGFSIRHIDYKEQLVNILMNRGPRYRRAIGTA